jgi:hypothetical protein
VGNCGGCGKGRDAAYYQGAIRSSKYTVDERNMIALTTAPECAEPYHGAFQGARIYVLGYGTPDERLFRKGDYLEATKLARTRNLTLDTVLAVNLCHDTMVELLQA